MSQNGVIGKIKEKAVLYGTAVTGSLDISLKKKSNAKKQALFIFNFYKYVTWPGTDSTKVFNIVVMGDSGDVLLTELKAMANDFEKTKKGEGISFSASKINHLDELSNAQIFYFDKSSNLKLDPVYKKLNKGPTLMVTEGYPFGASMFNLVVREDKVQYEINETKCEEAGFKVNWLLSKMAVKSEKEWDSLLDKMESLADTDDETIKIDRKDLTKILNDQKRLLEEIAKNTEKLDKQKEKLKTQQAELTAKENQLAKTKQEISVQKGLIDEQLARIDQQQRNLATLNSNISVKHDELVEQEKQLEIEARNLIGIQNEYKDIEKALKTKELLVKKQGKTIDDQGNEIITKSDTIEEQKSIIWLSAIFLLIVSILGILAYRSYRLKNKANILIVQQKEEIEEQHEVLEEQHREITDSINYAKRIQDAILPPLKLVKGYMPDSFILYQPKDIVAGDFYWMEGVNNLIIFAAADCTGHGVPGAMVSVVCHNAMNRAVREFMLVEPHEILNKTRDIVTETFEKSDEDVRDGMDVALCTINTETNKLSFSGANNGLYFIRDGQLTQIKPDKQPIGRYDDAKPFTKHDMDLEKGDVIYTFSDGYADQFGGPKGKKFMYKPFRELLLSIHKKPMEEQQELLMNAFENWRGAMEQVDDVCVIGVRI